MLRGLWRELRVPGLSAHAKWTLAPLSSLAVRRNHAQGIATTGQSPAFGPG